MQQVDVGGGRGWLAPGPAASLRRIDAQLGYTLPTSSLGRTAAEQQKLIDAFNAGDRNVFQPAAVGESPHQQGISADVPSWRAVEGVMNANGWFRPLPKSDPVHFNYDARRDQHINDTGGFLMALTDAQQQEVYDALVRKTNDGKYFTPDSIVNVIRSEVAARFPMRTADGHEAGYDMLPAIINQGNAILAAIGSLTPGATVDIDDLADKLAAALGPDVARAIGQKLIA